MKRALLIIIPILIVVSLIVYAVNHNRAYKAHIEAEKIQKERIEKNISSTVAKLQTKHNAFDWVKEVESREELLNFAPVMTVELERLWLTERLTLFIGTIGDISTFDEEYYLLRIDGIGTLSFDYELELKCPIKQIKSLLEEHPDLTKGLKSGVAVVANIESIKTAIISGREGAEEHIRIGVGKAIDMVYVADTWSWHHQR